MVLNGGGDSLGNVYSPSCDIFIVSGEGGYKYTDIFNPTLLAKLFAYVYSSLIL